ncbi:hypothetical protein L873DRAFT_752531 [Choiromyces venosus 120613-1]|uniref:Uncharacterized protein n=1 Tax=Choiromyces venosus 120613-1 TaxID=1336337 RepID=A0A3N4ISA5_9PEZI|nr:hypothetical protein L873DRAFT_752531 [Choiromyces venosus 120613-1]
MLFLFLLPSFTPPFFSFLFDFPILFSSILPLFLIQYLFLVFLTTYFYYFYYFIQFCFITSLPLSFSLFS